ncbi:MAG TPA: BatA and WFA domain-containing protein, partial [Rhodothermales bacterium]
MVRVPGGARRTESGAQSRAENVAHTAISFLNSIFLFATAAAAIPVVLHLVRRMKAKTVPFPSLMFIRPTPQELTRKRRLKDVLLMAARMAMIVLLALAFARPFLASESLPFTPAREAESVVLVLDRSFSMRYDGAFDRALQALQERIDRAAAGDEFAVIAFSDQADLLAPLSSDVSQAQTALAAVEPGFAATDYLPALQRAADVLAEARHRRKVVVLTSDFQETGWARVPPEWKLPPGVVFETVSLAADEPANSFVEAFLQAERRVDGRNAVRFEARVAALGDAAEQARTATLEVDGVAADRADLPARATAPVTFERLAPRDGYYQG